MEIGYRGRSGPRLRSTGGKVSGGLLLAAVFVVFGAVAHADTITVTFDPSQPTPAGESGSPPSAGPVSGNEFSLWGVDYQLSGGDSSGCAGDGGDSLCFGDTSTDAFFSLLSGGELSGPIPDLSGDGSTQLTLTFAGDTNYLAFDLGIVDAEPAIPAEVTLCGDSPSSCEDPTVTQSLWTTVVNEANGFTEDGEFVSNGLAIHSATITFDAAYSQNGLAFALDNLEYDASDTPEPGTLYLLSLSGLAILVSRRLLRSFKEERSEVRSSPRTLAR